MNKFQLNSDKTEVLLIGNSICPDGSLQPVLDAVVHMKPQMLSLGVLLDLTLCLDVLMLAVSRSTFSTLSGELWAWHQLFHALVKPRRDYCNVGLPLKLLGSFDWYEM